MDNNNNNKKKNRADRFHKFWEMNRNPITMYSERKSDPRNEAKKKKSK